MIWLIVLVLLVAVFGLGTLLEAALWTMLLVAVVVLGLGFVAVRALSR